MQRSATCSHQAALPDPGSSNQRILLNGHLHRLSPVVVKFQEDPLLHRDRGGPGPTLVVVAGKKLATFVLRMCGCG